MRVKLVSILVASFLIAVLLALLAAEAQPTPASRRIGFLSISAAPQGAAVYPYLEGFRQGLRDRGWIEGQTLSTEYRWMSGGVESLPGLARELVRLNVELIVTYGNKPPHVIKEIVKPTPIVALSCDPLETMVTKLASPGGNITGLTCLSSELTPKKLELLLDAVPNAKRLVVLYNPADPGPSLALKRAQDMARQRQLTVESVTVSTPEEFERGLTTVAQLHPDALYVYPDPLTARFAKATIEFAAKHRLPAV